MYVLVAGSGEFCYQLAVNLAHKGHEVTVVSRDRSICERVEGYPNCAAVEGYGWDPSVLEEAGLHRADALVACEATDEENLVICHLAELLRAPVRTIAIVHNPKNDMIFRELGIDAVVDTTTTLAQVIEHELPSADLLPLITLRRGGMQIVEGEILEGTTCVGKTIQEIGLPQGVLIITLVRNDEVLVPHGGSVIKAGDVLVALSEPDKIDFLRRALFGR